MTTEPRRAAVIRIGVPLRDYLIGIEPVYDEDPVLWDLVDMLQGLPMYPAGVDLDELYWSDVYYFADLLQQLDPNHGESRAARAALTDLGRAGYRP